MTIQANQGFGVSVFGGGGGSTSPGGSSGQVQYNASGSFAGMAGTSWDDTNRALTLTGATVTTSQPVLNLTQTWNAGAVTFTGLKFNATDTASASGSLLLDIGTGGGSYTSAFNVTKTGGFTFNDTATTTGTTPWRFLAPNLTAPGGATIFVGRDTNTGARLTYDALLSSAVVGVNISGTTAHVTLLAGGTGGFLYLRPGSSGATQLGAADAAAPVAQTLQVQSGSGTDINGVAFNIGGSKSTGTGTAGLVNIQTSSRGAASGTSQNVLATVASFGPNTLSGSQAISLLDMAQTWNTSGTPTAIKLNVTDTASASGSLLLDIGTGGGSYVSQFSVSKAGLGVFKGKVASSFGYSYGNPQFYDASIGTGAGFQIKDNNEAVIYGGGGAVFAVSATADGVRLASTTPLAWSSTSHALNATDVTLYRDAANTLALRNGANAQKFRVYNTYTSSTNYENFEIDWQTTANIALVGPTKGSGGGTQRVQRLQYLEDGGTGATTPSLGTACPAASATIKSWIKVITSDGTTAYIPCWA